MNALEQSASSSTGSAPYGALWPELKHGGEPLSPDRLDARAVELARAHAGHTQASTRRIDLLSRLEGNSRQLVINYRSTLAAAESGGWISPAGEWLLDNFHVISEHARESRDNLPRGFYRELPELSSGPSAGLPRVFAVGLELIACTDGLLDVAVLERFLAAYQAVEPLTIGELWALPTALRHAFLDRLASIAARVDAARREREAAASLAEELTKIALTHEGDVAEALRRRVSRRVDPSTTMFATELAFRLRDRHPALVLATSWIERRIEQQGMPLDEAIRAEHRSQAANQASVGNCIHAMRTITATDWGEVFESLSLVEGTLRTDPGGAYARMDFQTRDRYRHVLERIGKRTRVPEVEIARRAIQLASTGEDERRRHVGYWLIDAGLEALEAAVDCRPSLHDRVARAARRSATALYLLPILCGATCIAAATALLAHACGAHPAAAAALGAIALVPGSELAIALLHIILGALVSPTPLPKLDYTDGIPPSDATLVVVPMMLANERTITDQVEALELRHIANQDAALRYALLADFTDAVTEETPLDAGLLALATGGIDRLNERYAGSPFYVIHRPRVWCESEHAFLGWERKRGKLDQLNRLLLGDTGTQLCVFGGERARLREVRYVLTLDADTQLPLGAAARLVGTMAHPLNRAIVDETGTITSGYALLQPRVSISPPSARLNRYTRLYADEIGVDPYTSAVSDVYQDLFAEGSFVGKGLYDLRAFATCLEGAIPERTVLSHDLLEGLHARAGLASDIELFDDTPSHYLVGAVRRHRWIRGDWQLVPWLFGSPPRADRGRRGRPLSVIARWKIFDNLRRSLVAPAAFALFLVGWLLALHPLPWSAGVGVLCLLPLLAQFLAAVARVPRHTSLISHVRRVLLDTGRSTARALVALACLPHEAWSSIDAIARSLYRKHVSKRRLLEWVTAAQAERSARRTVWDLYRPMLPPILLAAGAGAAVALRDPSAALTIAAIVGAWALAPLLMHWLSAALPDTARKIRAVDRYFLRRVARKTWSYFDTFVVAGDHFLPPDNFQESPAPFVAHRTSPTNLGLSLLCNMTALDLGYLGLRDAVDRTKRALASMETLERYRGHFLNWYDTTTKAPLHPRYVSTVDSGNLAAMLITLSQALLEGPIVPSPTTIADGLVDTLRLVEEEIVRAGEATFSLVQTRCAVFEALLDRAPLSEGRSSWLRELEQEATALRLTLPALGLPADRCRGISRWCDAISAQVASQRRDSNVEGDEDLATAMLDLAARADRMMQTMDFSFLFDRTRQLFAIGLDVGSTRLDASYYDLLASESRIGSFVAIAKGDVPVKHWYRLGRSLTQLDGRRALRSWTGTMFEYLMPSLLMRDFPGTLLDETAQAVVERQIEYGREHRVPWGISESAYNARDLQLNYQYGPFGVPGLGLKRGLADDLVVAPYATMLALKDAPRQAVENLWRLATEGLDGEYGFCESIDYTPTRVPDGQRGAVVRAYMAHHQGMSLLALAGYLGGQRMVGRFHADPRIKAAELLLQERIPFDVNIDELPDERDRKPRPPVTIDHALWRGFDPSAPPAVQLLSNGSYSVMVSAAGGGYSRRRAIAVTRWREDPTLDASGSFFYLRDVETGRTWSPTHQPLRATDAEIDTCFSIDKAEFRRVDGGLETHLVVSVAAESDAEVRTLTLTNQGEHDRTIEVTSYAEVVLGTPAADAAHPAFGKLFVETERDARTGALIATRRPRSAEETHPFALHVSAVEDQPGPAPEHETDRAKFIGRGRDLRAPAALDGPLSGSLGAVLDPVFSLRRRIVVPAETSVRVRFTTAMADTREDAILLAEKFADPAAADRASALAWTHAQSQLHYLGIGAEEAYLFLRLAAKVVYADRALRARDEVVAANRRGQSALWAYGISGDLPIVLVRVDGDNQVDLVRELLHAHEYWRLRGLVVDLVIVNDHPPTYLQSFQDALLGVVRASPGARLLDKPGGGIFVRRSDLMPPEDRAMLDAAARVILVGSRGGLAGQIDGKVKITAALPPPLALARPRPRPPASGATAAPRLRLDNGIGGFSEDGKTYVIRLGPGTATPAPWINVLANRDFGVTVSELGSGYAWAENSHENRLTAWSNDPVSDPSTMAIYVRDDETGTLYTPTPLPIRGTSSFIVRHGQGYSTFSSTQAELALELTVFVAELDPVHLSRLTVRNLGTRPRRLTLMPYVEWTLGVLREESAPHVVTSVDESGALFARNTFPNDLGSRVAFFDTVPRFSSCSGDRLEVIGRNGHPSAPAALGRRSLSGRTGAAYDPCAAVFVEMTLKPGEERELVVVLGQVVDPTHARALLARYREGGAALQELTRVRARWDQTLDAVHIETPDEGLDLLVNRWLVYQVLTCRMWARTGLYQSGGAYGYRDQLQDSLALVYATPSLAREHVLRAAARQFVEGDAQHWWHPPSGRGVRTRFSDDYLWLPFVTAHYVSVTGDAAILDEHVAFIEARLLEPNEHEAYLLPTRAEETASLYEHCARALDRSLVVGEHGLPLIGVGDWNDGMSRVGVGGKGESVWMAWFLIATIRAVVPLCDARGETERAARYRAHADALKLAVEANAWDGAWYLRAFFDDGTPLGSANAAECSIDSLSQSWSVISGAGDPERAALALAQVEARLVDREARLVRLLAPPFDRGTLDPGYIKGYVPGVRENGGQYTHAAAWLVLAQLMLGRGDEAGELLRLLNPVHHTDTADRVQCYRVEPYVIAADVYAVAPHVGRGGWTWYTGSASWYYRVVIESLLGLTVRGATLTVNPTIPSAWPRFVLRYRHGKTHYTITVENPDGVQRGVRSMTLDGASVAGPIALVDDGAPHALRVLLGAATA